MAVSYDVTGTIRAEMGGHPPLVLVYDARGNGGGGGAICPTITGEHQNRVTDYTAIVVTPHPASENTKKALEHLGQAVEI